jgi:hypothetical protein
MDVVTWRLSIAIPYAIGIVSMIILFALGDKSAILLGKLWK